jgi:hypothetical protein
MPTVNFDQNPKITDSVLFTIDCPGADGCATANPYKVDKLVIYHVERDFHGGNYGEYESVRYDASLVAELRAAQETACADPSEKNLLAVTTLQAELDSKSQANTFYFKDAVAVQTVGDPLNPAWLSTDTANALLTLVEEDEDGNPIFGKFTYLWQTPGRIREGDYFVCWTWTPQPAGDSLSAHVSFLMLGDPRAVVTTPAHLTPDDKYETLLERYLPEMYKLSLAESDVTPETLDNLNNAVAKGFKFVEDFANQIIDLYDANSLHESLLVYLGNLFNLRLKSGDPTLWRRQIKQAIATFKKKGSLAGLEEAFSQAGMTLTKFTQLWQVVSKYTWVDSFKANDSPTFTLTRNIITPIDEANFTLWLRREGEAEYVEIDSDCVEFSLTECDFSTVMTWIGDERSSNPIKLFSGDILKVLYQYASIPSGEQSVEDYMRALPVSDTRDEAVIDYPPKNWNVKLIEEDDAMFDVIVPVRHPFNDPLVFGKVRTIFPYGENVYNMEEYNGSTRDSTSPCDIDKDFIDPCGACLSSKYIVDLVVENLSDERLQEVTDILREYTPFNAVPHTINFSGEVNEFFQSPEETINMLVSYSRTEYVVAGNPFFHRVMEDGLTTWQVTRDQLASEAVRVSNKLGTAYNSQVRIITPNDDFRRLGVFKSDHLLKVLSPSPNAGEYTAKNFEANSAQIIQNVTEPLNESMFTFNLYNLTYDTSLASITQADRVLLADADVDFTIMGVKTLWDEEHTEGFTGSAWKARISSVDYEVADVVNGSLLLYDPGRTLPTADTSVSYLLFDDSSEERANSTGDLTVTRRGLVDLNDTAILDVHQYADVGTHHLLYDGVEYQIIEITDTGFYISDYSDGDAAAVTLVVRETLVNAGVGYFQYSGLMLLTDTDHEAEFGMLNGANPHRRTTTTYWTTVSSRKTS